MKEQAEARCILFTLAGVPFTVTSRSWQFVPPKLVIGLLIALLVLPDAPIVIRLAWGFIFGLLLLSVPVLHIFGHVISSKFVSPPMTETRIKPALIQTLFQNDPADIPGTTHLIRSLGGPLMNLLLGIGALFTWNASRHPALLFFSGANFMILFIVLLPLPSVDGEVIWREARQLWKR